MNMPNRELTIKFKDRSYVIEFPNTGKFIDISIYKANVTRDAYSGILLSNSSDDVYARFLIDMTAFFNICCPELIKDLQVKISDLNMNDSKLLMNVYLKKVLPWQQEWTAFINQPIEDEE